AVTSLTVALDDALHGAERIARGRLGLRGFLVVDGRRLGFGLLRGLCARTGALLVLVVALRVFLAPGRGAGAAGPVRVAARGQDGGRVEHESCSHACSTHGPVLDLSRWPMRAGPH